MIGIGGCGMSGLARMIASAGVRVTGSDTTPSDTTAALADEGIPVSLQQDDPQTNSRRFIGPDAPDLVVASAAIKPDNPELLAALEHAIPAMTYAEALGACMTGTTGVAIAGTHGKSTTTAMLGCTLADAGLDPSVIVGATCRQLVNGCLGGPPGKPASFRLGAHSIPAGPLKGRRGLLIAEACEFNRSFHNLHPRIAAITSVEADHLDIYGSIDAVIEAFATFARLIPSSDQGGCLLIAHEGAHRNVVAAGLDCVVQTIGLSPEADWIVSLDPESRRVTLTRHGGGSCAWNMRLPGVHNAMNAAFAAALAQILGADPRTVSRSLSEFRGLDRRTQFLGQRPVPGGVVRVWDDYGHHPTEVDATLRALRDAERIDERGGRLVCVFQPHQHSRTRHLMEQFATAFESADVVIVPHIYFVRDSLTEKHKVSASDLVDRLRERGVRAMHLYPFDAIVEHLHEHARPGDTLVVMGAGPVWQVAHGFLSSAAPNHAHHHA